MGVRCLLELLVSREEGTGCMANERSARACEEGASDRALTLPLQPFFRTSSQALPQGRDPERRSHAKSYIILDISSPLIKA
jgi:hypothetical protein